MRYWIGLFILCITGNQYAFADTLIEDKPTNSITFILLGLVVLFVIFFMLYKRQKRRYND